MKLMDFNKKFKYENDFYLSCDTSRMGKIITHYELFKMAVKSPGAIVECGVFKGISLARFAMFRELLDKRPFRKIVGFDIFGKFPESKYGPDKPLRKRFIKAAGIESISRKQMRKVLSYKGVDKSIELVSGDITRTIPEYLAKNKRLKISLLNLDVDIYEPSVTVLEYLYPRIVKGGILIIDDYGTFPGETKAVNEYFKDKKVKIRKFPFAKTPCYIVKE